MNLFTLSLTFLPIMAFAMLESPEQPFQNAIDAVPASQKDAMRFLIRGMPVRDLKTLSADFLVNNVTLAYQAYDAAPWKADVPEAIFLNYVLPYTSIHEEVDPWRPLFVKSLTPLVKDCKTTTEAAIILNREIWKLFNVTYSPNRDKADQSPFHSMRIHIASCTGLSILLVDACRAVGVPARFVGCIWHNKPGNHSWVEFYDRGQWYHLGAEDSLVPNETWFNADAAHAVADEPMYAIYATSWEPTGLEFFAMTRRDGQTPVPAHNVTERYLTQKTNSNITRLSINLTSEGKRIVRPVLILEKESGKLLAKGSTHDNTFDLNNHLNFAFPEGTSVRIVLDQTDQKELGTFTFGKESVTLQLTL